MVVFPKSVQNQSQDIKQRIQLLIAVYANCLLQYILGNNII